MDMDFMKKIAGYLLVGAAAIVSEVVADKVGDEKLEMKIDEVIKKNYSKGSDI